MRFRFLVLFCLAFVGGCSSSKPETLVETGYDEQEMNAAIETARSKVDQFIAELQSPTGEMHSVKIPVREGEKTEHFWLTEVSFRDDAFHGKIGNDPGVVGNVKFGDSRSAKKTEISDWMYLRNEKIHGNYTMRPLLKNMPAREAAKYRSLLAEP